MITLYEKDGITKIGELTNCIECLVEEERNGIFELSIIYPTSSPLYESLKEGNIVVANANDILLNQKFRIYLTRKCMNNRVEVFARHISFDLMYDYVDNISFKNQSCQYVLNKLFRNSNFSRHYIGYSDIVNAQDYNMNMANILEAIGGKQGSIIDTFGTGAEILRNNETIHILNKRGYDNGVTIEYRKNLTGFELEEDTTDLVTRILPYAKYNDSVTNNEIIVKANYVDSPLIANYSHPYIKCIDYSDKFDNDTIPTVSKLQELAIKEYRDNKVDIPKQNFKIEFIPLSKCVGYESLEDKISICDTVSIIDTRYNIKTKAKVIRTVFNVLKNRYEAIELGEPKTNLGDIIGNGNSEAVTGPQGPPGADGNIGDFPNSLPNTPIVTATVYGFSNIEISWTFENKGYYQYEVYASKEPNFTPNTFNLIHQGQTSTFMYQAKPNETWYFKVCCINSHGNRTSFGSAYATTSKINDLSNYVSNMAINDALIGTLRLDRGWIGTLKGNYIDAKQLSVTDGNGKRTLYIDSFGNVNLSPNVVQISFNGINERININERSMDFTSTNGNRDMSLYGGQVCIYNNTNNTFMSTIGSVLKTADMSYKGVGFLLGKNANIFTIGRDATWDDILSNRNPNTIHYVTFNFDTKQADIDMELNTNDINMRNHNLRNSKAIGTQKLQTNTWYDLADNPVFTLNKVWGHIDMYKDLEANYHAILNARLVNPQVSYTIVSGHNVDVNNDTNILIANEDVSIIDEQGNVSYDLNEMIKLLYKKINSLENEIESLKKRCINE